MIELFSNIKLEVEMLFLTFPSCILKILR